MQFQLHLLITVHWSPVQTVAVVEHTNQGFFSSYLKGIILRLSYQGLPWWSSGQDSMLPH